MSAGPHGVGPRGTGSLEDVAGTTPGPDRIDDTHGTQRAIRRHERDGEPLCEECRVERNRLAREYYRLRKEKP